MFKLIKRLIIFIVIIIVIAIAGTLIFLNSVKVTITEEDLPEEVYNFAGNLDTMMQDKSIAIVNSNASNRNSLFEDFLNIMIYKTIKDNINPEYDPINGETEESKYIVKHSQFTLDYMFVEITEDDQVKLTVSIKRGSFPSVSTAFYFYFDMEVNTLYMNFKLTLDKVYLDDNEIKYRIYDYFVSFADKDEIESQADKGTLDLDEYTYEMNFIDVLPALLPGV
jgi:hypothetical protein